MGDTQQGDTQQGDTQQGDTRAGVPHRWLATAVRAVARRPSLWTTGVRQGAALAPRGWWRRRPFLPVPAAGYLRFRLETAYGGEAGRDPAPEDVVTWLRWCRDARRWRTPGHAGRD